MGQNDKVGDEGLRLELEPFTRRTDLEILDLTDVEVTDQDLSRAASAGFRLPSLRRITLNSKVITDQGLGDLVRPAASTRSQLQ